MLLRPAKQYSWSLNFAARSPISGRVYQELGRKVAETPRKLDRAARGGRSLGRSMLKRRGHGQTKGTHLMRLQIVRLENGQYLATSTDFPGLVAQGRTKSEVVTVAQRWSGSWSNPIWHVCTDPSHPPLVQFPTQQETLYKQVLNRMRDRKNSGVGDSDIVDSISAEVIRLLSHPSDSSSEGYRLQQMRRQIAKEWGTVFRRLDNLAHLAGWFVLDCIRDKNGDELHFVLRLLALESIRSVFATVNQLRAALTGDTFGYWRTLYETFVKSQFLLQFTEEDADLPGRFSYYTNSMYLEFYRKFAPADDEHASDNTWTKSEEFYASRYNNKGKGSYGWAYPLIPTSKGQPHRRPTFRQLAQAVDKNSASLNKYYDVATSKTHGQFIMGDTGIRPSLSRSISVDSFSVGNIALVLEFTMPHFEKVLLNACASCTNPEHRHVLGIVRTVIAETNKVISDIKSTNPDMHG